MELDYAYTFDIQKEGDRKSVVQGKSVDLGGRRIIKKKKKKKRKHVGYNKQPMHTIKR